jgi:uncharacterized membrane protein YdbT with pleckstrin-like domain
MTETTARSPADEPEQTLWEGRPSQWTNFGAFCVGAIGVAAPIAAAVALGHTELSLASLLFVATTFWKWLQVQCTQFTVTTERIKTRRGVLSRERNEMELYRVKDTALDEPLLLRLVSRANVRVMSSDRTSPVLVLNAIAGAEALREQIRRHVERLRDRKRVREVDFD